MTIIEKSMTIADVLNMDRNTAPIMMGYGMHCMGCPYSMMESLEDACAGHGADVNALVRELNDYFASKESEK